MKEQKIKVGQVVPDASKKLGFEFRITLIYLLIGTAWIVFSDEALDILVPDHSLLTKFQTFKGSFYVVMTALVLFILVRRQMRKIREQQLTFESMFHTISDAVIISTPAREIVLSNKGVETTFGYSQEEILGRSSEILYAKPEEFKKSGTLLFGEISEKNSATYISYYRDKAGTVFPGETHGTRLFDSKGVWIGNVAIIRNISERLDFIDRIEKALLQAEQSERNIRSTLDNMLEGCQIIGLDWIYQYANHSASAYCAIPRDELPGRRFDQVWKNIAPEGFFTAIGQCMSDGVSVRGEYEFVFQDGQHRWFDTRIQKTADGIFILTVDFTKRRQAEEKMHENELKYMAELEERVGRRTMQLEASNKELESFSYSVSHDLRAPLRHVGGFVNLLLEGYHDQLPDKAKHYLDVIAESVRLMGVLIEDLLQFSKTGRQKMNLSELEMNHLVNEAVQMASQETNDRKIVWEIEDLPGVTGDRNLLRLVWDNLISNAVKFTRGRQEARISIGCTRAAGGHVFFISDNGAGFDMKHAHKLFGVFQRLHSSKEFEGTGIGLANVHAIITRHGGRVWAESTPGAGATFFFTLPEKQD